MRNHFIKFIFYDFKISLFLVLLIIFLERLRLNYDPEGVEHIDGYQVLIFDIFRTEALHTDFIDIRVPYFQTADIMLVSRIDRGSETRLLFSVTVDRIEKQAEYHVHLRDRAAMNSQKLLSTASFISKGETKSVIVSLRGPRPSINFQEPD